MLVCAALAACTDSRDAGGVDEPDAEADASEEDAAPLREVRLIDHTSWRNYAVELDPLPDHQPDMIKCGISGWFVEAGSLEVDTGNCNYLLIEHPTTEAVPAGTELEIELGHFDLVASEPATAHVALLFDAELQWEDFIAIPGPGNLERSRFRATRDLAAGEPIRLHLHNHGQNTWLFGRVIAFMP